MEISSQLLSDNLNLETTEIIPPQPECVHYKFKYDAYLLL